MPRQHEMLVREEFEGEQKDVCLVISRRYVDDIPAWWIFWDRYFYARVRLNLNSGSSYYCLELRQTPPS